MRLDIHRHLRTGPSAIEATARGVRARHLLYGSERPAIEPFASGAEELLRGHAGRPLETAVTL
jgi:hypothetical protein